MRYTLLKSHSTKPERIFYEILKEHKLAFLFRTQVHGFEIDFILGKICVEIDGHPQRRDKNRLLLEAGYHVIHYANQELLVNRRGVETSFINFIQKCQQQT